MSEIEPHQADVKGSSHVRRVLDFDNLTDQFARKLIYLVGNARGGSTFTRRAISIHPQILEVRWNDKTFSDIWPKLRTLSDDRLCAMVLDEPRVYNPAVAAEKIGDENANRFVSHVEQVCRRRDLRSFLCLRGILSWIMDGAGRSSEDFLRWCLKANTWQGVDAVKTAIPEARLVFVQRDPRSTSLSFAKVYARDRGESFDNRDVVRGAMSWLRNATEFGICLDRYPDAHLVLFEQIIDRPGSALNKLYAQLGLDAVDAARLRELMASIRYSATHAHEERGKSANVSGIQTAARDRWREQLSEDQARSICALTAVAADYYGYALGSSDSFASAVKALRQAKGLTIPKYLALYLYSRACLRRLHRMASAQRPHQK